MSGWRECAESQRQRRGYGYERALQQQRDTRAREDYQRAADSRNREPRYAERQRIEGECVH